MQLHMLCNLRPWRSSTFSVSNNAYLLLQFWLRGEARGVKLCEAYAKLSVVADDADALDSETDMSLSRMCLMRVVGHAPRKACEHDVC
jgi:hypothetical protein